MKVRTENSGTDHEFLSFSSCFLHRPSGSRDEDLGLKVKKDLEFRVVLVMLFLVQILMILMLVEVGLGLGSGPSAAVARSSPTGGIEEEFGPEDEF